MQDKANSYMNKFENVDRELKTKKSLISQIGKQKEEIETKQKEKLNVIVVENKCIIYQNEMMYEDLLSKVAHLQVEYNNVVERSEKFRFAVERLQVKVEKYEQQVKEKDDIIEEKVKVIKESEIQIKELKSDLEGSKQAIIPFKKAKMTLEDANTRLNVDLKKKDDQLKDLFKKLKKYEKRTPMKSNATPSSTNRMESQGEEDIESQVNFSHKKNSKQIDKSQELNLKNLNDNDNSPIDRVKSEQEMKENKIEKNNSIDEEVKKPGTNETSQKSRHDRLGSSSVKEANEELKLANPLLINKKNINKRQETSEMLKNETFNEIKNDKIDDLISKKIEDQDKLKDNSMENNQNNLIEQVQANSEILKSNVDQSIQTELISKDAFTDADIDLLLPLITENASILYQNQKLHNPHFNERSNQSIPTAIYERSDGVESRNNNLIRDDSQNTYVPNYLPQINRSPRGDINDTRASVHQDYTNNSPILSKDSIHHMSNNSTIIPSSIKNDLYQLNAKRDYINNSPSINQIPDNSIEYTDEAQNTYRSDDLLNTSTELENSRQSVYPIGALQNKNRSPQPQGKSGKAMRHFSQQPGYIDKGEPIIELPNREELISNPKSREQSHQSANRQKFINCKLLSFHF